MTEQKNEKTDADAPVGASAGEVPTQQAAETNTVQAEVAGRMPLVVEDGGVPEAREILGYAVEAAREGADAVASQSSFVVQPPPAAPSVSATNRTVVESVTDGGPAFGSFVKSVGLAVAEAQAKFDETFLNSVMELSKAKVEVIAIFEQQLKDETGEMDKGNPIVQALPAISYITPTALRWENVRLESHMKVSRFDSQTGFHIQGGSSSFNANAQASFGLLGFGASGGVSYSNNSYNASGGNSFGTADAAGTMDLEATIRPRADIRSPEPIIVQKGPRLRIITGNASDITKEVENDDGTKRTFVTGRKVTLTAELTKTDGSGNDKKRLTVTTDQPGLNVTLYQTGTATPSLLTDEKGLIDIEIRREGGAYEPGKPLPVVVGVRFGLVTLTNGIVL